MPLSSAKEKDKAKSFDSDRFVESCSLLRWIMMKMFLIILGPFFCFFVLLRNENWSLYENNWNFRMISERLIFSGQWISLINVYTQCPLDRKKESIHVFFLVLIETNFRDRNSAQSTIDWFSLEDLIWSVSDDGDDYHNYKQRSRWINRLIDVLALDIRRSSLSNLCTTSRFFFLK